MRRRALHRIVGDTAGSTVIEFAALMPVFVMLLMAGFDIAFQQYAMSVLDGEVAKAGRDSALESGSLSGTQTTIDTRVRNVIHGLARDANVTFSRRSFSSYTRVASPGEPFIDSNADGACSTGETYEDSNRNGVFDATNGSFTGFSGAKDAIVYTATATYPRRFPLANLMGWNPNVSISASTVLKIQPFTSQAAVPTRTCP